MDAGGADPEEILSRTGSDREAFCGISSASPRSRASSFARRTP